MEQEVLQSWNENAEEWIKTLEEKAIPSRKITDKAITSLLFELPARKILDCGCGEGWLTRSMSRLGKTSVGIDATLKLIENAKTKGSEAFYLMTYDEISKGEEIPENPFDAIVFNFCLYQKEGLLKLLRNIKLAIVQEGNIIIQTMHPFFLKQQRLSYKSQWISDSWKGLSGNFKNGHSWYARTFEDWAAVFKDCELRVQKRIEVNDLESSPLSIIYVLGKVT